MANNKGEATNHDPNGNKPYDWSADPGSGYAAGYSLIEPVPVKKKKRVFMWFFLAVQVLFLLWIIVGAKSGSSTPADTGGVLSQADANSARDAGTAIGVGLLIAFWVAVDILLGIIWAVTKFARR